MKIGVIDYGVGNLGSITNTLTSLGCSSFISSDVNKLKNSDGLILPGDGAAGEGMKNLVNTGLDTCIKNEIKKGKPFFGICLGMQILLESSEEGNVTCLEIIKGSVKKIKTTNKLPQIGWNTVQIKNEKLTSIMNNIETNSYFYFINSYICNPKDPSIISGTTQYGDEFCSVYEKENVFGIQFHPEKSGDVGKRLLKNFIKLC